MTSGGDTGKDAFGSLGKGKTEPNAEIRTMAQLCWQMYVALKDEGFAEKEALTIVTEIMQAGVANA